ncbi:FMN-dependent NADH-azoreductase [Rhizomicrobium palustre]|uniref:FMN dependent NADH:quinone oxidoreductase n=1 Tax=Rhizomicrobium palustre TaxID=189966 RepID=A0A846MZJ1_9PROT|nr:FMN-dependent NADH-azoreductase [Rhizomicrobium palustre]NIK89084.1 FMN-dependent NADH-azoreductase [Rhizomicrobium palustre]
MNLLHVDSSILGGNSVSRQLSAAVVARLQAVVTGLTVISEDLAAKPLNHLSPAHLAAAQGTSPETAELQADVDHGQKALADFLAADIVVVAAPLYNFGVPSQLKAWIDRIAVAGKTFRYTEKGPEGLAGGKKVIIVSSRGGFYEGTPLAVLEHQESYLKSVFGFMGITDIAVIRAEGVNYGPEHRQTAIDKALAEIGALSAQAAA